MEQPLELVLRFCAAWSDLDLDHLISFFTEDAVYHNMPLEPVTGVEAIRATISGFTGGVDKVVFEVLHAAAAGEVVLTERVDHFHLPGRVISLPVMGTFEVAGGSIRAWRDYFDMNQFMSQMAPSS
ncbi:MAG TPA: limonene-1,2-epoxide hydrolase family protein [Acidimicrobiales bacterium]|nr:limonene-1,2-epoxide hydrolase family protein [Acidimicrobiales bacterium]